MENKQLVNNIKTNKICRRDREHLLLCGRGRQSPKYSCSPTLQQLGALPTRKRKSSLEKAKILPLHIHPQDAKKIKRNLLKGRNSEFSNFVSVV